MSEFKDNLAVIFLAIVSALAGYQFATVVHTGSPSWKLWLVMALVILFELVMFAFLRSEERRR